MWFQIKNPRGIFNILTNSMGLQIGKWFEIKKIRAGHH